MDQVSDPFDKGPPGDCLRHSIFRNFSEIINYLSNHSWQYGSSGGDDDVAIFV